MKIQKYKKKLSAFYLDYSFTLLFKKKIKKIILTTHPSKLTNNQKTEISDFYSKYGLTKINFDWHRFLSNSIGVFNKEYIPEDIYYTKIEPTLNRKSMGPALMDKNTLSIYYKNTKQPKTIINNINGYFYSYNKLISKNDAIEICTKHENFVIKPSIDSGGGKKVKLYKNKIQELNKNNLDQIFNEYKQDFILQEVVIQNKQMQLLNESSLNTIRIFSYLRDTDVVILSSIVRVGRQGQFTDNSSAGGISCGIKDNGKLKKYGFDSLGKTYTLTDNNCLFDNFMIPFFDEILKTTIVLHKKTPNFKLISWDLAIDQEDEIVLIEYNTIYQEINFHQLNNGPLFGNFTDEILNKI